MKKEDLLLETVKRVGIQTIEEMSKTDDRFISLKLKNGEIVVMRINSPEREEYYKKVIEEQKESRN